MAVLHLLEEEGHGVTAWPHVVWAGKIDSLGNGWPAHLAESPWQLTNTWAHRQLPLHSTPLDQTHSVSIWLWMIHKTRLETLSLSANFRLYCTSFTFSLSLFLSTSISLFLSLSLLSHPSAAPSLLLSTACTYFRKRYIRLFFYTTAIVPVDTEYHWEGEGHLGPPLSNTFHSYCSCFPCITIQYQIQQMLSIQDLPVHWVMVPVFLYSCTQGFLLALISFGVCLEWESSVPYIVFTVCELSADPTHN